MNYDQYSSPLVSRNASPEMAALFSPRKKFGLWRRLWLALARAERELGVQRISTEALEQMEANVDNIDFALAEEWERKLRHDVMAHIHAFEAAAPAAKGIVHLGATSQFVVCNAELIIMREALQLIAGKLAAAIDALGTFALQWKDLPTLGYTHYQPAQLTTVGKRATLWAQDLVMDLEELEHRIATLKFRSAKGTTGTQASFLELFEGDAEKVARLEQMLCAEFGFESSYAVTGQTYPRKVDAAIVCSLGQLAASVHRFANDIRLLAGMKQMEEPFETSQVGSSAMPYKRNPMRCERATGLSRLVMTLVNSPLQTAAEQWFERTLDDSSNRRVSIAEAFLAAEACVLITLDVSRGLVVYPKTIEAAVMAELPFMASEQILMSAVQGGGDRQVLHEKMRQHAQAAANEVKQEGRANDLIARLRGDAAFAGVDLGALMRPERYVGLAPLQTERFVAEVVEPVRQRYRDSLGVDAGLRV